MKIRTSKLKARTPEPSGAWSIFESNTITTLTVAALLFVSAGFLSLEIASRAHPLLAWFTLLPLLAAIRIFNVRIAVVSGAFWGASLFYFLALSTNPTLQASFKSAAFLIGFPAVYSAAMVWVTKRFGFNPLILAFGWCGVELALLPLGLRGGLLGGIAGDSGTLLSFLQGFFGYVCMAALIVAVNAIALSILTHAYAKVCSSNRHSRGSSTGRLSRVVPLENFVYWCFFGHATQPRAPPGLA